MRCDDERIPGWVLVLGALALLLALAIGVATTASANPASTNVFLGRGATPVVFRSKTTSAGSTTVTVPAGAAVGDIAVVVTSQSNLGSVTITSGGGAWSSINVNGGGTNCGGAACLSILSWKVLVLADLSGSWTVNQSIPYTALDYVGNGATTLALRETESNYGGASLTFTGYTPVYATRGALSVLFSTNAVTPTVPTGFTLRDATTGAGSFNTPNSADLLNYQSGGPVWTSLGVVGGYGGLLEFSGP